MLTKNDKCFFALAFYRQTLTKIFRSRNEAERKLNYKQACYWWEQYQIRRSESRLTTSTDNVVCCGEDHFFLDDCSNDATMNVVE